jgi:hypothetical protein
MGFEFALQPPDTFLNAQRVKLNPLTLTALLPMPIGGFKTVLGACGFDAKKLVMPIKAVHHRLGNVVSDGRIKSCWKHRNTSFVKILL